MTYEALFSERAAQMMLDLPDIAYLRLSDAFTLLATQPEMGRAYNPTHEEARSRVPLHVQFVGNYGIYYTPDHDTRTVYIRYIEDQRMNPLLRFSARRRGRKE